MATFIWPPAPITPGGVTPPPAGSMANYTYTASTLATRPAITSLADGTLVFVESNRSWYRSDLAGNTWRRLPVADESWMSQTAWGIDTTAGSDENVGSVASPLRTFAELVARLPVISLDTTVTIAAGSAFAATDWWAWLINTRAGSQATTPTLTINGTRTLVGSLIVAASTDEAGNVPPTLDVGAALTIGGIYQSVSGGTSGATTVVESLISGTNYRVAPWRTSGGGRTVNPGVNTVVSLVSLPTCPKYSIQAPTVFVRVNNVDFAKLDDENIGNTAFFKTCHFAGAIVFSVGNWYDFAGCSLQFTTGFQFQQAKIGCTLCAIIGVPTVLIEAGTNILFTSCLLSLAAGMTLTVQNSGYLEFNSLYIRAAAGSAALNIFRQGNVRMRGTLYGTNSAGGGANINAGGHFTKDGAAAAPTLTGTGQELALEGAATAIPPLTGGGAVPAASALTTWAQWAAAPFSGQAMSYASGSSLTTA